MAASRLQVVPEEDVHLAHLEWAINFLQKVKTGDTELYARIRPQARMAASKMLSLLGSESEDEGGTDIVKSMSSLLCVHGATFK